MTTHLTDADLDRIIKLVEQWAVADNLTREIYRAGLAAGRTAALEEAAKACEALPDVPPEHGITYGKKHGKEDCAAAIRSLAEDR